MGRKKRISEIIISKIRGGCLFISALILGWGLPEMTAGHGYAPYLIAIGCLAVVIIIITDKDVRKWLSDNVIKIKWLRISVYILVSLIVVGISFSWSFIHTQNKLDELSKTPIFYGELVPDDEPNPITTDIDNITLLFGDHLATCTRPSDKYVLSYRNNTFLKIGINKEGNMVLNAKVYDDSNHKIVNIIDNEFQANPDYAFHPRLLNRHTLVVRNSEGKEVLNVYFVNPKVMRITGTFFLGDGLPPVEILPQGVIRYGDISISGGWPDYSGYTLIDMTNSPNGLLNFQ